MIQKIQVSKNTCIWCYWSSYLQLFLALITININKYIIKLLEFRDFTIEYLKLEGYFGTFNSVLSAFIYGIINAIIPILIAKKLEGTYINNLEFLNINENKININLNCIISIKMVNIINILHYLKKKGGNNNGKSSYRRSYAYSNE